MPEITLPDGSVRRYTAPVTGAAIAADIGPGLARAALVAVVNGEQMDLDRTIGTDATVSLVTRRDEAALEIIRHDAAHVMAEAVLELFPETQVTIGPAIETGFYYDFYRPTPFTPADLERIEQRMHEIVDRDEAISREVWTREDAVGHYRRTNEPFKVEIVEQIPEDQTISFYRQGGFLDLCRGPHAPSTRHVGHAFKLMSLAGAYWRGDSA